MKQTIELEYEQIDAIVVKELQDAYRLNVLPFMDEGGHETEPDYELIKALETVLQYFMSRNEYDKWIEQYASRN